MNVLAEVALVAIFLLLLGGLAFRRSRAISPASFSWTELLDEAISGVSTAGERLDEMREIFDPPAYVEVSPDGSSWSPTIREGLRERARRGRSHIALVEKNIGSFERL